MSMVAPVAPGTILPVIVDNNNVLDAKATRENAIQTMFLKFLVDEMDVSKMGSVTGDGKQLYGVSLLMNQMLQRFLIQNT